MGPVRIISTYQKANKSLINLAFGGRMSFSASSYWIQRADSLWCNWIWAHYESDRQRGLRREACIRFSRLEDKVLAHTHIWQWSFLSLPLLSSVAIQTAVKAVPASPARPRETLKSRKKNTTTFTRDIQDSLPTKGLNVCWITNTAVLIQILEVHLSLSVQCLGNYITLVNFQNVSLYLIVNQRISTLAVISF